MPSNEYLVSLVFFQRNQSKNAAAFLLREMSEAEQVSETCQQDES